MSALPRIPAASRSTDAVSGEVLVERAAAIAERLVDRGAKAEELGRIPAETIAEVIDAGLMRSTVPRRFGGLEVDFRHVPQIQRALGRGCLATSWTIGILIQHNYQLGFYSKEVQEEVWANGPDTFIPGYIVPGGVAKPVPGGYRLTGTWRFGSGYPHGQWLVLGAHELVDGEKKGPLRRFVVPIADAKPQNNWQISGLAATGTWDCTLDDVFAPAHRSILAAAMLDATAPGTALNTGPMWRIPMIPFYYPNMSAMMLGAAEGVARLATEAAKKRVFSYGGAQAASLDYVRANLAMSQVKLNAIGALLDADAVRVEMAGKTGASFDASLRASLRANCTYVVKQSREVVNEICDRAGTQSFLMRSPLQRFLREVNVLSSHAFYDWDRAAITYGQAILEGTLPEGEMA